MSSFGLAEHGQRFTFDCSTGKWDRAQVTLRLAPQPFAEGGMRLAYHAREILPCGDEVEVVVKIFKEGFEEQLGDNLAFDEAMTQMVAENYAQAASSQPRLQHDEF